MSENSGTSAVPALEIEYYRDKDNGWRWRAKAQNGRIVGAASEGFHNHEDAVANFEELRRATIFTVSSHASTEAPAS